MIPLVSVRKPWPLRLLDVLTLVTLLLAVAVAWLWVRSHFGSSLHPVAVSPARGVELRLVSFRGRIWFEYWHRPDDRIRQELSDEHQALEAQELAQIRQRREAAMAAARAGASIPPPSTRPRVSPHSADAVRRKLRAWNDLASKPRLRTPTVSHAWPLAILLAAAAALRVPAWMRCRRAARRAAAGNCPQCGYDLRGTPGRCPECGAGLVIGTRLRP